jgi:hypothetical protein
MNKFIPTSINPKSPNRKRKYAKTINGKNRISKRGIRCLLIT